MYLQENHEAISDLFLDLQNGTKLLYLLEILTGTQIVSYWFLFLVNVILVFIFFYRNLKKGL